MSQISPLSQEAVSLISSILRQKGPQTTAALYTNILSSTSPLPARPLPANFLAGARRISVPPPDHKVYSSPAATTEWTRTYLKKNLLRRMELGGTIVKMTRGRWERASAPSTTSASSTSDAATSTGASLTAQKGAQRKEEEHVWVDRESWEEVLQRGIEARREGKDARRAATEAAVEGDLRKEYGLNA